MRTVRVIGLIAVMGGWGLLAPAGLAQDLFDGLPAGPGREEVYYTCNACHSLALVKQQGLSRARWDETLKWMAEEQGMAELEPAERSLILDYLSTVFGEDRARPAR